MPEHSADPSCSFPPQPESSLTGKRSTRAVAPDWLADLYTAASLAIQKISQADSIDQALRLASEFIESSPFVNLQFFVENGSLAPKGIVTSKEISPQDAPLGTPTGIVLSLTRIERLLESSAPLTVSLDEQATLPGDLVSLLSNMGVRSAALIPVWRAGSLFGLYVLGARDEAGLNPLTIQPYVSMASQVSTTIDKVLAMGYLHRRVAGLQSLASISQAISVVTNFNELFGLIHEKICQVMGEIDLAIALYDAERDEISIPYAYEAGEEINLPPFPLGQGLTSILIRTQQPLMLVEDAEKKALELGARITGAAPKSWLGVPLTVANEVLGAIIVQDAEHEHRFDLDDLRLMTTLAAQISITLRNIRLYQNTRERAERERMLAEITSRIWSCADIESIAKVTLEELGRALKASAGSIELSRAFVENSTNVLYQSSDLAG